MKIILLLPITCLVSLTLAEPPVGDGYPAARSPNDHHHDHHDHHNHHSDHQRSLSQEYGPPSFASRNAISDLYVAPNAKASSNPRGRSQFPPATVRVSFNQRFNSGAARNSDNSARNYPQEHANARGISEQYGPPTSRSLPQKYEIPSSTRSLSNEYGVPKSSPSQDYGVPVLATRSNQKHSSSNAQALSALSQDYSAPKSTFQTDSESGYPSPSARSSEGYEARNSYSTSVDSQNPSQTYGAPYSPSASYGTPSSRSLSASYGAPSTRNFDSNSQDYNSIANSYTASTEKDLSETYGAPNARSLSQKYGVPASRTNQKTEYVADSYPRSSPSPTYLPAARDAVPSQQYGVPDQDNQGYENARARALNELLNQEPANYDFAYQIEDQESGNDFGHTETREENRAEGSYFVVLPDGTKQTVEYEADEGGFKPRITVEPAAAARSGGYDDNAQDLENQGPY